MKKENFLKFLQNSSPEEVKEFILRKGKRKLVNPIIELPPKEKDKDSKEEEK